MKKKPIKSAFGAFFREQAGPEPLPGEEFHKIMKEVDELEFQLEKKRILLRRQTAYDLQRQWALYAWCARDKK